MQRSTAAASQKQAHACFYRASVAGLACTRLDLQALIAACKSFGLAKVSAVCQHMYIKNNIERVWKNSPKLF
jgi:hypothetical protein